MDVPQTRYANAPDGVEIAYQRFGVGPVDLAYIPYFLFNIDLFWDFAPMASWLTGLGRFARVILHDPRGSGLSDRDVEPGDLGTHAADLIAALDDADVPQTAVFGSRSCGAVAALLAATHTERVTSLVWTHAAAATRGHRITRGGRPPKSSTRRSRRRAGGGGSEEDALEMAKAQGPMGLVDADFQRWMGRMTRSSITPRRVANLLRAWHETDVRDILPTLSNRCW